MAGVGDDTSRRFAPAILLGVTLVGCLSVVAFSSITGSLAESMPVGTPSALAGVLLTAWAPRRFGWRWAATGREWRYVLTTLIVVVVLVGSYRLTGQRAPYDLSVAEVMLVPVGEEALFRGFMLTLLVQFFSRRMPIERAGRLAILIGAISFGAGHLGNLTYVPTAFVVLQVAVATGFGLLAGWARLRTGSLIAPILLHAALNLVAVG